MAAPSLHINTRGSSSIEESVSQFYSMRLRDSAGEERELPSLIGEIYRKKVHIPEMGLGYYPSGDNAKVCYFEKMLPDLVIKVGRSFQRGPGRRMLPRIHKSESLPDYDLSKTKETYIFIPESLERKAEEKSKKIQQDSSQSDAGTSSVSESQEEPKKNSQIAGGRGMEKVRSSPEFRMMRYFKESLELEIRNIEDAKKVCKERNLTRIVIPKTIFRKISVNKQEEYDVIFKERIHSDLLKEKKRILCSDKAIEELVLFILFSDYSDCYPRNFIPINEGNAIAIVDFGPESKNCWELGLFGNAPMEILGLWDFVPESQHKIIIDLVSKHGFDKDFIPRNRGLIIYNEYMAKNSKE